MQWVLLITIVLLAPFGCLALNQDELKTSDLSPTNFRRALLKALTDLENEDSRKSGNNEIIEHAPTTTTTATTAELNTTKISSILVQKSSGLQHPPITTIEKEELDPFNDAEKILTSFTSPNRNLSSETNQELEDGATSNYLIIKRKKLNPNTNKVETTTVSYSTSTEENEAKVEDVQFFSAPLVAAFTVHQDALGVPKKVEPIFKVSLKTDQEKVKLLQDNKLGKNDVKKQDVGNLFHSNAVLSSSNLFGNQQLPNKPPHQFNEIIPKSNNVVSILPSNTFNPLTEVGQLPLNGQILPVRGPINFHTPIVQTASFHQFHSIPQINPSLNFNQRQAEFDLTGHQRNRFLWQDSYINNNLNENSPSFSIQKSIQSSAPANLSEKKILTSNFNSLFATPGKSNRFFRSNLETNYVQPQNHLDLFRSNHYDRSQVNQNQFSNALINSGAFEIKSLEDINIISKVLSLDHLDGIQFANSQRSERWIPSRRL